MDNKMLIEMVLTMNCNMHCEYCFQKNAEKNNVMPKHIMDATIKRIEADTFFKKYTIAFFGGEPTLAEASILYILEKIEPLINPNKIFNFAMSTNGTKPEAMKRIEERVIAMGCQITFNLSNKDGMNLAGILSHGFKNLSYTYVLTSSNSVELDKSYIDKIQNLGIKYITIKPDMYGDITKLSMEELDRVFLLSSMPGVTVSMALASPGSTVCASSISERVTVLTDGVYGMCTRVTMGDFNGYTGHVLTDTLVDTVNKRFALVDKISENGMCLCKTDISLRNSEYIDNLMQNSMGLYDVEILARD